MRLLLYIPLVIHLTLAASTDNDDLEEFSFDNNNDYYYTDNNEELDIKPNHNYNFGTINSEYFADVPEEATPGEGAEAIKDKDKDIKLALINAMKRSDWKRKFAEVLPILRVMSPPQKVMLAALVSAQANARPGRELTLSQVQTMFGTDRSLMLPIVLDIANLIRDSARSENQQSEMEHMPVPQALSRSFDEVENIEDNNTHVGEVFVNDETKFTSSLQSDLKLGYKLISNKENITTVDNLDKIKSNNTESLRKKKIIYSDQIAVPSDEEHISVTLTSIVPPDGNSSFPDGNDTEVLPQAEELRALHRYYSDRFKPFQKGGAAPQSNRRKLNEHRAGCERFSSTMCLYTEDYPMEAILSSIHRNKNAMTALLAEFRDNAAEKEQLENEMKLQDLERRGDEEPDIPGSMCPSVIRYARPQKARSATGQWKYIVNTGEHTQTLRLEKCSRPMDTCTYLTENFKSRCVQVFNYHRLLSWDNTRGLHVDIFKVPTCCSCHIDGYSVAYPPNPPIDEVTREIFPGEEYQDPNQFHTETELEIPEETNHFHFNTASSTKKFNKLNLGLASFDSNGNLLQQPSLIKEIKAQTVSFDVSKGNTPTPRRKPSGTKNNSRLPSYLEAPKPPNSTPVRYLNPPNNSKNNFQSSNNFKRGTSQVEFVHRQNGRRPLRNNNKDQFSSGSEVEPEFAELDTHVNKKPVIFTAHTIDITTESHEIKKIQTINPRLPLRTTLAPSRSSIKYHSTPIRQNIGKTHASTIALRPTNRPMSQENIDHIANSQNNGHRVPNIHHDDSDDEFDENGKKRVNYNYHPIIDFFENEAEHDDAQSRVDNDNDAVILGGDSDWRPMNVHQ